MSLISLRGALHAGGMGLLCGSLHALGPDHLATLVTFSTPLGVLTLKEAPFARLMPPIAAAKVGASWGIGHCFGVVVVQSSDGTFLPHAFLRLECPSTCWVLFSASTWTWSPSGTATGCACSGGLLSKERL